MRDKNVFTIKRGLPRMSWHPQNLYNLWRRSTSPLREETVFIQTSKTLFQQRWASKRLTRAYHGDFINEKIFKRWYLPSTLPDVRPQRHVGASSDAVDLNDWAMREKAAAREKQARADDEKLAQAPVASLMYEEVERRIDVFIFRCCFAHSVYEARRLVIHGDVLLNGKKHQNANTRLAPGDMVSVNPEAIRFLKNPPRIESSDGGSSSEASSPAPDDSPWPQPPSKWSKPSRKLTPFHLPPYAGPFIFIPAYIEVSFLACSAIFLRRPTARYNYSEIPTPYEADGEIMRLSWEWYSRVRPRMRSKSQLARMPENRRVVRRIPGLGSEVREQPPHGTSLRAQMAKNSLR